MHAVIRIGSHQYNVKPGEKVLVEKLDGSVGSEVRFRDVLMISDGSQIKVGSAPNGTVVGRIVEQVRGPKIIVFKKQRRKGFHRTQGHRQSYTRVEITGIESAGAHSKTKE